MATVNMGAILKKAQTYIESARGQKQMKSTIEKYIRSGVTTTQAGSYVPTIDVMNEMSEAFIRILHKHAASLPSSVAAHFGSLRSTPPKKTSDGSYIVEISFADDLSRASLQPYDYSGAHNIVAIFNNGYPQSSGRAEAISHVSGFWHGEYVHARGSREGLHFMQDAVDEFNGIYGSVYNIYITLSSIYES
jgi:hypothetical protein|nr:MAG TPA: hypothetical protein [Bacteriophage sp.]